MTIPRWIFFLVAAWVLAFGLFRIRMALRRRGAADEPARPNFRRRGLYALPPRSHLLFGVLYLLLGSCLVAIGFGWQPMLGPTACAGDRAAAPSE